MSPRKLGEDFAQRWVELGLNELRNAAAFEQSNVVDDIRRSASPQPQQEWPLNPQPVSPPEPQVESQQVDLHQER